MTLEELRQFIRSCVERMTAISSAAAAEERAALNDTEQPEWDQLERWIADAEAMIERHERLEQLNADHPASAQPGEDRGAPNVNRGDDPYDVRTLPFNAGRGELRGRALTAIERTPHLSDRHREAAVALLERHETPRGDLSRHILGTGSEAYRTGWQKLVSGNGHLMDEAERHAVDEARALSLTDAQGGFAVPFTLDPTIISTKDVSTNPFRRVATVRTTVTDQWQGVTSGGMTVTFAPEAEEVGDNSPTLDDAPIPVHRAHGFAVASIEITQDWASIESDLRDMIQEGKDDKEAEVFTTGTGTNEPTGLVTALDDTASEVDPATGETFAVADVYALEEALPPKYRLATLDGDTQSSRAAWFAARATYNSIRQFDTQGGAGLLETLGNGLPPRLLGYSAYEASAMRSTADIDTGVTAENPILILGDPRGYVIVDRIGLSVEFIPHIFGTQNNRPTGQRGWYVFWRVGADVVNVDAFRMLNVATSA